MKSKLVRYPFNEKKYRWNENKLGKKFEYSWDKSADANYKEINPYIEVEDFVYDDTKTYAAIDLSKNTSYAKEVCEELGPYTATTQVITQKGQETNIIDEPHENPEREDSVYILKKNITKDMLDLDKCYTKYTYKNKMYLGDEIYYTGTCERSSKGTWYLVYQFWDDKLDIPEGVSYKTGRLSKETAPPDDLHIECVVVTTSPDIWPGGTYVGSQSEKYPSFAGNNYLTLNQTDNYHYSDEAADMRYLCILAAYWDNGEDFWKDVTRFDSIGRYDVRIAYKYRPKHSYSHIHCRYWTGGIIPPIDHSNSSFIDGISQYVVLKDGTYVPNVDNFSIREDKNTLFTISKQNLCGLSLNTFEYICSNKKEGAYVLNLLNRLGQLNPLTQYVINGADIDIEITGSSVDDYEINVYQNKKITFNFSYDSTGFCFDKVFYDSIVWVDGYGYKSVRVTSYGDEIGAILKNPDLFPKGRKYHLSSLISTLEDLDTKPQSLYYFTFDENFLAHDEVYKLESRTYKNKEVNTEYIVDVNDWKSIDSDMSHYIALEPSEIKNAKYLLKPNALLIGDKTEEVVDITANTTLEYYLADPPSNTTAPFIRKNLQFNAPSNFSSEPKVRDTLTIKWKSQDALNAFIANNLIVEAFYYGYVLKPTELGDVEFGWSIGEIIDERMAQELPDETMDTFGWYIHATDINLGYGMSAVFNSLYLPHNPLYPFTITPSTTTNININDCTTRPTVYNYTGNDFYKLTVGTNYTFASQEDLDNFKNYLAQFNYNQAEIYHFWNSVDLFDNLFEIVQETYYEIDNVWLTFNSYKASEYLTGYHFEGKYWNSIFSPYGYVSNITKANGDRTMALKYGYVPEGKYANLFEIYKNTKVEVKDSNGVSYITNDTTLKSIKTIFHNLCGGIWMFDDNIATSNDRNAYPDKGSKDHYGYVLRPQDTKFIEYYRTNELEEVKLFSDRYTYSHDDTDFCDRSYQGMVVGDAEGTHEDKIPDARWRTYLGLYLGEDIPSLGLIKQTIPSSILLTQPEYNKEVNTSETLKYGTVSSASIIFTVDKPIELAKEYINNYLILYYDFENNDDYKRMGWFYVDGVEAIDEYTTRIIAHDEVYKLNKYVDDFMNSLVGTSTLDATYRALLTYCGCQYDTQYPKINNGDFRLYNSYNTAKTTGIQVIHYIAQISPGFIEANIDGDIVLSRYLDIDYTLTTANYSNLEYTPFNSDILNKVKILINNTVRGEDAGTGENAYYIDNSPIITGVDSTETLNNLAQSVLDKYNEVPSYRPATITLLILPETTTGKLLKIGDCINIKTKSGETYKVVVMTMNINASGITITSIGSKIYPVEGNEVTSQFINLVNQIDNLDNTTTDIKTDLSTFQKTLTERINQVETDLTDDIKTVNTTIGDIQTEQSTQNTNISNLQTTTSAYSVNVTDALATITLNGIVDNIATKAYVDAQLLSNVELRKVGVDLILTDTPSYLSFMYIGNTNHTDGILLPLFKSSQNYNTYILSDSKLYSEGDWNEFEKCDIKW